MRPGLAVQRQSYVLHLAGDQRAVSFRGTHASTHSPLQAWGSSPTGYGLCFWHLDAHWHGALAICLNKALHENTSGLHEVYEKAQTEDWIK